MLDFKIGNSYNSLLYQSQKVDMPSSMSNQTIASPPTNQVEKTQKIECQTCKNRTYQDQSNDPSVSFKSPGNISPEASAAKVMSHEQEHVTNEQANAEQEGREVVSQTVSIETAVCPECQKVYVSGGETRTVTSGKKNTDAFTEKYKNDMTKNFGLFIDAKT